MIIEVLAEQQQDESATCQSRRREGLACGHDVVKAAAA
jgi:hypothetical protein